jgi:tyrosyl-tRNA synthetase
MKNIVQTLFRRGLIDGQTHQDIDAIVEKNAPMRLYCGFDPTADSLHLGHLVAIMGLGWFRRYGHIPTVIVGGATGLIGDPSGKSQERNLLSNDVLFHNVKCIRKTLDTILSRIGGTHDIVLLNNNDWFSSMNCIEFLRDVGKHFRIGTMLGRESVRTRLAAEEGMSYTEFSYQLLQAYDFYHLFSQYGVSLQLGGSDQWGNITAGIELIRRLTGQEAWGLTFPLLVKSDGKKFGKSEQGAIWLSEEKLSVYDFYQYLVRTSDQDVIRLLKALTLLDIEMIDDLEQSMARSDYQQNSAQKLLAAEVTRLVHGEEGLQKALKTTAQAMPGAEEVVYSAQAIKEMLSQVPSFALSKTSVIDARICDVLATCGFVESRAEARRNIKNGGVAVNSRKISDEFDTLVNTDLIEEKYIVFSLGKKRRAVLEVT